MIEKLQIEMNWNAVEICEANIYSWLFHMTFKKQIIFV